MVFLSQSVFSCVFWKQTKYLYLVICLLIYIESISKHNLWKCFLHLWLVPFWFFLWLLFLFHIPSLDVAPLQCFPMYHLHLKGIIILRPHRITVSTVVTKWINPKMASPFLPSDSRPSYTIEGLSLDSLLSYPQKRVPQINCSFSSWQILSFSNILVLLPKEPQTSSKPLWTSFTSSHTFTFPSHFKSHLSASHSGCASVELNLFLTPQI